MKRYYALLVIICIFLSSCGYRHVIGYSGNKLPESQVAILLVMLPKDFEKKFNLVRYQGQYGIIKVDNESFGFQQQSVELLPGNHEIGLESSSHYVEKGYNVSKYYSFSVTTQLFNFENQDKSVYRS